MITTIGPPVLDQCLAQEVLHIPSGNRDGRGGLARNVRLSAQLLNRRWRNNELRTFFFTAVQ
jgi:hypothetical protein